MSERATLIGELGDHCVRLEHELAKAREWPAILSGWGGTP